MRCLARVAVVAALMSLSLPGVLAGRLRGACDTDAVYVGHVGEGPDAEQFVFFMEMQLRRRGFRLVDSVADAQLVIDGTVNTKERTTESTYASVSGGTDEYEHVDVVRKTRKKAKEATTWDESGMDAEFEATTRTRTVAKVTLKVSNRDGEELGRYFSTAKTRGRPTVKSTAKEAARYVSKACARNWYRSESRAVTGEETPPEAAEP